MPFQRQRAELRIDDGVRLELERISRSRTESVGAARGTCETAARLCGRRADCAVAEHEPPEGMEPACAQGS